MNSQPTEPLPWRRRARRLAGRFRRFLYRLYGRCQCGAEIWAVRKQLRSIQRGLPPGRPLISIGLLEHFGDIVACEPVARPLRREHPTAYIVWLVREPYRQIVDLFPTVDQVITL